MKKHDVSTPILILCFFAGIFLLLYPSVSNYLNRLSQSYAVQSYTEEVEKIDTAAYEALMTAARQYNVALTKKENRYAITEEDTEVYMSCLNISGDGVIGSIEIPTLGVTLPIYHGTSDSVLRFAVGHLQWSSLPIGGKSTHTVVSGHRGLPSARLFTDLDKLEIGDRFQVYVLQETLTYEVDQILIVKPQEIDPLVIEEGADLMTLVTCTPYGINTHRLLVRGHRVENAEQASTVRVTADAILIDRMLVVPLIASPVLLLMFFLLLILPAKRSRFSVSAEDANTVDAHPEEKVYQNIPLDPGTDWQLPAADEEPPKE